MAYAYRVGDETVELEVDPRFVAVRFRGDPPHSVRAESVDLAQVGNYARRFEVAGEKLTIIPLANAGALSAPSETRLRASIEALDRQEAVATARPVFMAGANRAVAPDRIIFAMHEGQRSEPIIEGHHLKLLETREDKVICETPEGEDVFAIVAKIANLPGVRFAEPDLVTIAQHLSKPKPVAGALAPAQPVGQYALEITKAKDALALQQGQRTIRIAVIDDGVDGEHRDLKPAIERTYDAVDGDTFQQPESWDYHGTSCAGLAVGAGTGQGRVQGTGAGCALYAIRMAYQEKPRGGWVFTFARAASAVRWAWQNGADVISNSWECLPSNDIKDEIERAVAKGRNGKGTIVVGSAGNDGGPNAVFPARLDAVICVAATNEFDELKTRESQDGEDYWATNTGPQVDIAAPGVHNLTTDVSGEAGHDAGDYNPKFNGTSSAAPLVAGACGLILSAAPKLKASEVRQILTATADKIGQLPYPQGRNNSFGYGRLNVLEAVKEAKRRA